MRSSLAYIVIEFACFLGVTRFTEVMKSIGNLEVIFDRINVTS